jgi:hypothetical protein
MVAAGGEKYLRFVLQTAKSFAVYNAIPIPLESRAKGTLLLVSEAP